MFWIFGKESLYGLEVCYLINLGVGWMWKEGNELINKKKKFEDKLKEGWRWGILVSLLLQMTKIEPNFSLQGGHLRFRNTRDETFNMSKPQGHKDTYGNLLLKLYIFDWLKIIDKIM